jgi:hypothetical protein
LVTLKQTGITTTPMHVRGSGDLRHLGQRLQHLTPQFNNVISFQKSKTSKAPEIYLRETDVSL